MRDSDHSLDSRLQKKLDMVKSISPRDARAAARGKSNFLAEAESLRQTVPARSFWRRIGWDNLFQRKEHFRMAPIMALLVALTLAAGGSSAAVYASQDALPNDLLYPVKILSEDARVNLTGDAETRANLLLDLSNRRANEIAATDGTNAAVIARQQAHIATALQIAAGLNDDGMMRVLARTCDVLDQGLQTMSAMPALADARAALAVDRTLAQTGMDDQLAFRAKFRNTPDKIPATPTTFSTPLATPAATSTAPSSPTDRVLPTIPAMPTIPPIPTVPTTNTVPVFPTPVLPTIPPAVTLPAGLPSCIPFPPNWTLPPAITIPACPWPTNVPTPSWTPPTIPVTNTNPACIHLPPSWTLPPEIDLPICPWPANVPTPNWTPPAFPTRWWTPPAGRTPVAWPTNWPTPPSNITPPADRTPIAPQPNITPPANRTPIAPPASWTMPPLPTMPALPTNIVPPPNWTSAPPQPKSTPAAPPQPKPNPVGSPEIPPIIFPPKK